MIDAHYAVQKRGQMVSTLSIIAVMSLITAVLSATIPGHPAIAQDAAFDNERFFLFEDVSDGMFCSATARAARNACGNDVRDDYWTSVGNCTSLGDVVGSDCLEDAEMERLESRQLCADQFDARLDLCDLLGEAPYDPMLDHPDYNFVDPLQIGRSVSPNPHFPLERGRRWVYEGGDETITVTVTDETKLIGGVTCITVNDRVEEDGVVIEDTDDWYAQDIEGNVWYCGEIAQNFEVPEGEDDPELVDVEGSWKAFRDFARPGIIMLANPRVYDVYRQEFALGDAEDAAEILSVDASATVPGASCQGDCVLTRDFTPLEPDVDEQKYYAPGVGLILEVGPDGDRVDLVSVELVRGRR